MGSDLRQSAGTVEGRLEERAKLSNEEFSKTYAGLAARDKAEAQALAQQFAVGVLVIEGGADGREKIFVPPNSRLVAGRLPTNEISIDDANLSRKHAAFVSDGDDVYVEDLGSSNGSFVLSAGASAEAAVPERVVGRRLLAPGDVVILTPERPIEYQPLGK